ncbi:MAG: hypothetical protein IMZ69_08725 [Spirochaetes bacterium]|nr:hypothetical protein [Spirochaetota bacterium]
MRSLIPALGILLLSASAVAQDPVNVDPKHHKVEVDNPQVRVLRLTLGAGEKTPVYDHPASVAVFMGESTYRIGPVGGPSSQDPHQRGDVVLIAAGKHSIENLGSTEAEMVVIELKTPAIKPWKDQALDAVKTDPNNFRLIVESDEVRVFHATAKAPPITHEHPPYVYVLMAGGSLPPGTVQFRAGPVKHTPQNDGVTIMVELKTQAGAARD